MIRSILKHAFIALSAIVSAISVARACPGDCDSSGAVAISELLRGVNIALGTQPLTECTPFDTNTNGSVEIGELVAAVNAALGGCPATPTPVVTPTITPTATIGILPIFPASYRNTYVEVRSCRFSVEHGGKSIRVLANPIAVQPYLNNENPLPLGSIIVKEEFDGSDCSNDLELERWRVMRKEAPGFDSEHGDWHWQWVERTPRHVLFDDKLTCIGCHLAEECVARDYMCTHDIDEPTLPPLRLVFDGLPGALLAAAGTSPTNVFVVGADPDDGVGPYVLHYNGGCWKRLTTGAAGTLWWISFQPIDGAFYMVGDAGLILRYEIASGVFERQVTPGTQTIFGIWGDSGNNIWAVGGDETGGGTGGVIWHFDGTHWSNVDLTDVFPGAVPVLFKVWGRNDRDVYAVGRSGTILHYNGESWSKVTSNTIRPLFTVHGNNDIVVATGGFNDGVLVENDGIGFVDRTPAGIDQLNGVFVPPTGPAVGIGINAATALRGTDGWREVDSGLGTPRDFHAVWIDQEGGVWAVGGDLSTSLSSGVLVYGGSQNLPTEIQAGSGPGCGGGGTTQAITHLVPIHVGTSGN